MDIRTQKNEIAMGQKSLSVDCDGFGCNHCNTWDNFVLASRGSILAKHNIHIVTHTHTHTQPQRYDDNKSGSLALYHFHYHNSVNFMLWSCFVQDSVNSCISLL